MIKFFPLVCILILNGCASDLSVQGAKIRVVTDNQKEHCGFMGVITSRLSTGSSEQEKQAVINDLRNQVAKKGGNALHIISALTANPSSEPQLVSGEVLMCKF